MKIYVYLQFQQVLLFLLSSFDLAKEGKDFYMFAPHTVKQEYGVTLDDIDLEKYYDDMVANPNIDKKKRDARNVKYNCTNSTTIWLSVFNV